jgi:hypothetical protein
MITTRRLAIYLNDHLAGSTGGAELAKRALASNEGNEYGGFLRGLVVEIEEDRDSLARIMEHFEIRRDPVKQAGGWLAEKAGRAKLNGQLRGYSPLSRLVELEGLHIGVSGKLSCWQVLRETFGPRVAGEDLEQLESRARAQLAGLEEHRRRAACEAFAEERAATTPSGSSDTAA